MRGDILLIAPLVDLIFRRRVRWWSWTALVIVAVALTFVVRQRGGFHLPPLAIASVVSVHRRLFPAPRGDDSCR